MGKVKAAVRDCFVGMALALPWVERGVTGAIRVLRHVPGGHGLTARWRYALTTAAVGRGDIARKVRLPGGAKLWISLADHHNTVYFEGTPYEPATTAFFLKNVLPGDGFVDIGANLGYFSMLAARRVGGAGHVYAFEANPAMCEWFRRSAVLNGIGEGVTLVNTLVADQDREMDLYVGTAPAHIGISSVLPWKGHLSAGSLDANSRLRVAARSFDSWADEVKPPRIDIVKIDVEGAEEMVLQGMAESIARYRPRYVVCETGLAGPVSEWFLERNYTVTALELHDVGARWGNILYAAK